MKFGSPLMKKRRHEKTVVHPKRCIIHAVSIVDNSKISAFTEKSQKVSYLLTFKASWLFINWYHSNVILHFFESFIISSSTWNRSMVNDQAMMHNLVTIFYSLSLKFLVSWHHLTTLHCSTNIFIFKLELTQSVYAYVFL